MNKTKIEWCDYTINPVKGLCPMACPYCYARAMYKRFQWNPEIRWDYDSYYKDNFGIDTIKEPSRIFVGSTMELFGEWVTERMVDTLFQITRRFPQHTFIFLTKQPQNLSEWSPFPENCWVGVSPITNGQLLLAIGQLEKMEARIKFLSIEPLRNELDAFKFAVKDEVIDWVIIGQQTPVKASSTPKLEWVTDIVQACRHSHIPIFLKNNLAPLIGNRKLIQEFPALDKGEETK